MTGPGTGTGDREWYHLPVPVPDFTGDSGTVSGTGAKFSSGRVLVQTYLTSTCIDF